jgi:ABC-2 type transport system permease protein
MTSLIRTELLKLRTTRATWGLLAVALALTCARLWLVVRSRGTVGAAAPDSADMALTVLGTTGLGIYLVLLVGVLAVTGELRHQTISATFLRTPDRVRVLAAKAAACALAGVAAVATLVATATVVAVATGTVEPAGLGGALGRAAPWFLLVPAVYGVLGVGVGALVGNQPIAMVVPLGWFLFELLLRPNGLHWLVPWTLGGATTALGGTRFPGALPAWAAGLLLTGYGLTLASLGARRLARTDVT